MADSIDAFVELVHRDEELQRKLRLATTAEALSELAAEAGFDLEPAYFVKHYARLLLEATDELAVRNFNRCEMSRTKPMPSVLSPVMASPSNFSVFTAPARRARLSW